MIHAAAGPGSRSPGSVIAKDDMTSLEGVWRTAVRAAELETLMLLGSRGCPLLTVANGPAIFRHAVDSLHSSACGHGAVRPLGDVAAL